MPDLAYAIILTSKGRHIAAELGEETLRQALIANQISETLADKIILDLKVELGRRLRRIG